ncbi:respiratory nitrate reductase subunit gamma [Paenibacillus sp. PR3]|uniref:Respiratory nitrate reductase subunit gamma n=1 Tax=Paenibacillus terricola TaxID=2763503 RepID=A0ABR8MRF2_9BACL|nr:respiratory nitrate reductase subunit gamma [Paenibacillus terricola]MBD3918567.1 respiratory nitrate reductase subunit gamma [Paenibacillus terricola]
MSQPEWFLWGVLPYMIVVFVVSALIWRYVTNPFSWTSKSSELLEKRMLKWGSLLFHYGIIAVFFGHVAGLLVPVSVYHTLGISDEAYHIGALAGGLPAGVITLIGVLILLYRRLTVIRIRATSSVGDRVAIVVLALVILTGVLATSGNALSHTEFDYRTTINPWLRGLMVLQPDPELMSTVPIGFKIHMMTSFALYLVFPFTRLVHVFSLPIGYLRRSYVLYRRRDGSIRSNRN